MFISRTLGACSLILAAQACLAAAPSLPVNSSNPSNVNCKNDSRLSVARSGHCSQVSRPVGLASSVSKKHSRPAGLEASPAPSAPHSCTPPPVSGLRPPVSQSAQPGSGICFRGPTSWGAGGTNCNTPVRFDWICLDCAGAHVLRAILAGERASLLEGVAAPPMSWTKCELAAKSS